MYSRLKFASLCRKKGKTALSLKILGGLHVPLKERVDGELMKKLTNGTIAVCNADDLLPTRYQHSNNKAPAQIRLPVELDFQVKCGYYKHLWLTASGATQHDQRLHAVQQLAAVADALDAAGWDQCVVMGVVL